jgi:hypothetical protein
MDVLCYIIIRKLPGEVAGNGGTCCHLWAKIIYIENRKELYEI